MHSIASILTFPFLPNTNIQRFGNALFHAIHHERLSIIRLLFILGIDPEAAVDKFGHKPEEAASIMGKAHIVRLLADLKTLRDKSAICIQKVARGAMVRSRMRAKGEKKDDDVVVEGTTEGAAAPASEAAEGGEESTRQE